MKTTKKLLSAIMAAAMVSSMGISIFAADAASAGSQTDINGDVTVKEPKITVSLPATFDFAIDSYQLSGSQVVPALATAKATAIINKSNVPLNVNVTKCTGTPTVSTSELNIVATAPKATATTKDAQLYLRAEVVAGAIDDVGLTDYSKLPDTVYVKGSATSAGDVLVTTEDMTGQILLCELARGAVKTDGTGDQMTPVAATDGGVAIVGIRGVIANGSTLTKPWATSDTAAVKVALNLVPMVVEPVTP